MRSGSAAVMLALAVLVTSAAQAQGPRRLNPMVALHEKGLRGVAWQLLTGNC